ncbi:hypothetical protein ONZ45_g8281 [Pleurotus djamor]|nr:hypothetical protein ONZ45_g8281 [Pleurotus djamor]
MFAPESPRWLIRKGRNEEALNILAYYHADGNRNDPLVQYEYKEIMTSLTLENQRAAESSSSDWTGWLQLLATPANRRRMRLVVALAFFSQWSGNGLVSYYLNKVFNGIGIHDATTQLLINGMLQIWNLFFALLGVSLCDRLGRRPLFLISTSGMFAFFLIQTVCSGRFAITANHGQGDDAAAHAVIAFIFLFYAAYAIAFSALIPTYAVEVLSYAIRAKGFTAYNIALSVSSIFNQYVNPIALDALQWKYYIFYCCWLLFELGFLYFFLVETKNRTLEESAGLFDGEAGVKVIQVKGSMGVDDNDIGPKPNGFKCNDVSIEKA